MSRMTGKKGHHWVTEYARRNCRKCGAPFTPNGPRQIYCGPECSAAAQRDCVARYRKRIAIDKG